MTQQPGPDPAPATGDGTTDESLPIAPTADPAAEPAVERSRFSQWLASFGLGELQNPLLTRARPTEPRHPGG
ncbi:MAG TPA: hypothetical protein VFG66_18105 [Gemmatimonadales bacterium]|jgi:hypothetical protein|nr:hypothetical protein [Gemmatimonadales bacterium]